MNRKLRASLSALIILAAASWGCGVEHAAEVPASPPEAPGAAHEADAAARTAGKAAREAEARRKTPRDSEASSSKFRSVVGAGLGNGYGRSDVIGGDRPARDDSTATPAVAGNEDSAAPTPVLQGTVYGEGVALPAPIGIADLIARAEELEGKAVRVDGIVTDVCPTRGCWMKLGSDDDFQTVTIKVDDGVIVFPMSAKGKQAAAEGVLQRFELNLEQTRSMLAEEAKERGEDFDPSTVTEPMVYIRIRGKGAVIAR